jgi:hypothetical protein
MNLLGDEAFVEELSRTLDLPLARAAGGLLDDPPVGRRQPRIPELRSELGYRQVEAGRRRPTRDQLGLALDRNAHAFDDREAVIRVVDREGEDIGERPRTEFLQQQEPAAESTGHAGG